MPLDIHIKPVEMLLFRSDLIAVGKFRCQAAHPLFRDSGPCSHHTFVFPRTVTRIEYDGGPAFVGTPSSVVFYNQYQLYTRSRVSDVDASDWYTIADDVLLEMVREHDRTATPERPFRLAEAFCDPRSFLEQRTIFDALDRGADVDPMHVEETMLRVLQRVVRRAFGTKSDAARLSNGDVDAVEHARQLIAREPERNLALRDLARECELSPFRLCRLFRAHTGQTMTSYRHSLRLRLALERLRDRTLDLTDLALTLGYSSHSHFTFVFRRHFGVTPSAFRARS